MFRRRKAAQAAREEREQKARTDYAVNLIRHSRQRMEINQQYIDGEMTRSEYLDALMPTLTELPVTPLEAFLRCQIEKAMHIEALRAEQSTNLPN